MSQYSKDAATAAGAFTYAQPGPPGFHSPAGAPAPGLGGWGPLPPRPRFGDVDANWAWVVVAVIFFWPLGFAAAAAAGRVVPAMLDGDYVRAQAQSRTARRLGIIALCLAAAMVVLFVGFIVILSANGAFDCQPDDPNC